jgi:hypothetical protein
MQIIDIHVSSLKEAVDDAIARTATIGGLMAIAVIHILELPDTLSDQGYVGGLFIAAIVACLVLAAAFTRMTDTRVWGAAGGLAALVLLGYILSRSVGLPGFTDYKGDWSNTLGLVSMVAEGLVVCLTGAVLAARRMPMMSGAGTRATRTAPGTTPGPAVG